MLEPSLDPTDILDGAQRDERSYRRGYSQGYAAARQDLQRLLTKGVAVEIIVDRITAHSFQIDDWRHVDGFDSPPALS